LKKTKLFVALSITALLCATFALTAYSALTASKTVTSSGRVVTSTNLGIYSDSACTQTLSAINWGNLTAGASTNYTVYIKNTGTARQTLSMNASSWSPTSAAQYITITWDQNNTAITASQVVKATLILNVSASVDSNITTFSNSITITGSS
jgi:hypothetical protein